MMRVKAPLVRGNVWLASARHPDNFDRTGKTENHAITRLMERYGYTDRRHARKVMLEHLALVLAQDPCVVVRRIAPDKRQQIRLIDDKRRVFWLIFDPLMNRIVTYTPNGSFAPSPRKRSRAKGKVRHYAD